MNAHISSQDSDPDVVFHIKFSFHSSLFSKFQSQPEASHSDSSMFQLVNRAWRVLNDESLRREYDARWKQNCLVQKWPIQDEVPFEEFEQLEHEDSYSLACRCGGEYVLSRTDIFFKADFVQCGSCSLCVQVMYPHDLQVDDLEMT